MSPFKAMEEQAVADPVLRYGGPRCEMFSHALCLGPGGPKVLLGTYSHMQ